MAITRDFKETVQTRALSDHKFREGLLRESIESMLSGDIKTGKALLRDYINATVGFEKLSIFRPKHRLIFCNFQSRLLANHRF